ncbi:MAG: DUF1232 domain-containing protein [Bacteroidales bacterium]|nr:DUF1232 domain-containing protein [Bacteroidales bacterium]MBE6246850.1 DUF1232 domain-containing protein [Bacteroidales bacterium]
MLILISFMVLAYAIMGKDIKPLLERVRRVEWRWEIEKLLEKMRPWALKAGRVAAKPLLQFYFVLSDESTSTADRMMIYAAIAYTVLPTDLLPRAVYKLLGILDDGVAILYVYRKIKDNITPEIEERVENTLNEWFGVEYSVVK